MCGINGIVRLSPDAPPLSLEELRTTRDHMASRGPDGVDEWVAPEGNVALGHRRLAIIDLSDAGAQPMARSGRYRIVYNGEIYNYRELREELSRAGVALRTASDTEVILALYERHGAEMLGRLRGMYALAIWDSLTSRLFLARDPYGIKPLYYSVEGSTLRFASQVKALEAGGHVSRAVDSAGLVGFLVWGSVPEPFTIRKAIRALPAGSYLEAASEKVFEPRPFADLSSHQAHPGEATLAPAAAVEQSVRYHLVSDVPVGAFLSAGLDSAIVTSLAARQLDEPMTTFTIRFDQYRGTKLDEGPIAARVARTLGTNHIEHTVRPGEFEGLWPEVIRAMDQPSIDGFNTYLVSKIASRYGLKVVLSGLGGDELFGSYPSFRDVPRWTKWSSLGASVPGLAGLASRLAKVVSSRPKMQGLFRYGPSIAGAYLLRRGLFLPEEVPHRIGDELAREGFATYDPVADVASCLEDDGTGLTSSDWIAVHLMESQHYMRNQLLRDSDWASMAHSLELRVPFVDPKLHGHLAAAGFGPARATGKAAFFRSFVNGLPDEIWARPKSGFTVPVMTLLESSGDDRTATNLGMESRRLALRVLEEFGIDAAGG